ncbi:MFS transporter [Pseudohaliea rubra]|uniref:Permease of the major facilitator superfamily n=1 Tax=Pseudohaliea rubra DSM 19751 TaxID=1265313 RepID=A0A095VNI1_9GAMM|nr:MFS transporter [Pseudohaliea rubra]KGE02643.1 Permease of the major facilitator superfamily [Pseudohaliea rubra DSM 19751]
MNQSRAPVADATRSPLYGWYVVGILTVAYVFSYMDRSILTLLVEPIRTDLDISDTQLSLLHGFAFAMFYATLGIPIGRLADRSSRVRLIVAGVGIWSVFTAACGLARNFLELFVMRMLVGVGESVLNPCAYSIITDTAERRHLSRALSIYTMGIYIGGGAALILGGLVVRAVLEEPTITLPLLGEVRAWKTIFFYVGLPGLLLMAVIRRTVREPMRRDRLRTAVAGKSLPLSDVFAFLRLNREVLVCHFLGFSLIQLMGNAVGLWIPTFFQRSHGWLVADAGIAFGVVLIIFGPIGALLGGALADRYDRRHGQGGPFVVGALLAALAAVPATASTLVGGPWLALALLALLVLCFSGPIALGVSALQQVTPNEMRGQLSAVYLLIVNFLGIGFGPTLVALITDYGFGDDSALGYSLAVVGGGASIAAALLLFAGRGAFARSLERASVWSRSGTAGADELTPAT